MSMATESNLEKLQRLLRDMFQFDCTDLDFGIYRIMNHKRDAVERFIQKDLVEAISKEPSSGILASQSQAAAELKDLAAQIRESMGEAALNGDGNWSKQQFAEAHMLFPEHGEGHDYIATLFC
jgi:adenine-specific DNA-methyltransferase